MRSIVLPLPGNEQLAGSLVAQLDAELGKFTIRRFPDGETYVRIETPIADHSIILVATLDRPDERIMPLILLAATARDLGAAQVGLVAPYLAYMRQDHRFNAGEGVTSVYFAKLLSSFVDWLVTVDPHLHRRSSLAEIYPIPTTVVHAAPRISEWIRANVKNAVLIGPDNESAQWASAVAREAGAPCVVLEKFRHGDREVEVTVPSVEGLRDYTPVLVDDIISTARTMIETIEHLKRAGLTPPVCIGVHAVFARAAYEELLAAGPARIVTCNTITHSSNAIDIADLLADGVRETQGSFQAAMNLLSEKKYSHEQVIGSDASGSKDR
ncbi:MAG TPA: ribose-phosphate pyrophosphokinase [Pyrinomonadaceae bacterium]|jgi:ribose-phosphate pyrophosphokinase|nr:ribose-phosphate pyrophosphokinase [Pyrinomonadaceae bacterium]